MKKLNVPKNDSFYKNNFEIYCKNYTPTRHIKYKVINLAPINKSVMTNKLPSSNLDFFFYGLSVNSANYIAR